MTAGRRVGVVSVTSSSRKMHWPAHKPGEPHHYRLTCVVCGELGTIRVSIDPDTALDPAPSGPSLETVAQL